MKRMTRKLVNRAGETGKGQCEMIDKRRGNDIKKILAIDPEVLDWWTSI